MSCRRWECCVLTASWTAWVPVSSGGRGPGRFPFAPWGQSIEYFNNGMYVNNCNSLLLLLFSFFNSSFGLILFFLAFSCLFLFCLAFYLSRFIYALIITTDVRCLSHFLFLHCFCFIESCTCWHAHAFNPNFYFTLLGRLNSVQRT